MRSILTAIILLTTSALVSPPSEAQTSEPPRSFLALSSDTLTYPQGARFFDSGTWSVQGADRDNDGPIDAVTLFYTDSATNAQWRLRFGAPAGEALRSGFYGDAFGGSEVGAAFDIVGEGSGCFVRDASFTVLWADFDTSQGEVHVRGFAASFEQRCDLDTAALYGVVAFNAPPVPAVSSAVLKAGARKLVVYGERLESTTHLVIDGVPVQAKVNRSGVVTAKGITLGPGVHRIAARDATGATSTPFPVDFGLGLPGPGHGASRVDLRLESPGDPVNITLRGATWQPILADADEDGSVDIATFYVRDVADNGRLYQFEFRTDQIGPLAVRTYSEVSLHGERPGTAGLFIWLSGDSVDEAEGSFTVTDLAIDYTQGFPEFVRLSVTFEFRAPYNGIHRTGTLVYYADTAPVLGRARYQRGALTLSGNYFTKRVTVIVDGREVGTVDAAPQTAALVGVTLASGLHAVSIRNSTGLTAIPVLVEVP